MFPKILIFWLCPLFFLAEKSFGGNRTLADYIPARELNEFHFPIDKNYKKVWFDFYTASYGNDAVRILTSGGVGVAPSIIASVKDKKLYKRRYAIGALGYLRDRSAIPILKNILADDKELDYFKGDALLALYLIDERLATFEAKKLSTAKSDVNGDSYCAYVAKNIINNPASISKELP